LGSGRSEVLELVAGLKRIRSGAIAGAQGAVLVPEDRTLKGLVPTMSVRENIYLPAPSICLRRRRETIAARGWIEQMRVHASGPDASIGTLAGGNQQKVLLARALRTKPRLLLLDEPTAGIDVAAKAEIHEHMRNLAATGTSILLASSDLPEL